MYKVSNYPEFEAKRVDTRFLTTVGQINTKYDNLLKIFGKPIDCIDFDDCEATD
jgi:hypothetical protein